MVSEPDDLPEPAENSGSEPVGAVPYATYLFLSYSIGVFFYLNLSSRVRWDPSPREVLNFGANFGPLTTGDEPWRVVISGFLNVTVAQMFLTAFSFYAVRHVESLIGTFRYVLIFMISVAAGNICGMIWHPEMIALGGASGLFGVVAAFYAFVYVNRNLMSSAAIKETMKGFATLIALNGVLAIFYDSLDLVAIISGFGSGFLTGILLFTDVQGGMRARHWAGVVLMCALLAAGGYLAKGRVNESKLAATRRILFMDQMVDFGNDQEIYYGDGANEADAKRLGDELKKRKYFGGSKGATVRISREGRSWVVSMIIKAESIENPGTQQAFKKIGKDLSDSVFNGEPVIVDLCNQDLEPKKRLDASK